jgi:hypothetical protein
VKLADLPARRQAGRSLFDVVFLTRKSYDTCRMVRFIEPYLKEVD